MSIVDEFTHLDSPPELTDEELAAVSPPVDEPLVLDAPVSDASGEGGSGPAGDTPAEEAPAAEATEEAPATEEPAAEAAKTVPLATHIEDRKAHQAKIDEINAAHEARMVALIERFAPAPAAAEGNAPAEAAMPDPVVDPEGFERWLGERDAKANEARQAQQAEFEQQQRYNTALSQETAFKAEKPAYEEAFNHLRNNRAAEIKLTRPGLTDEQIRDAVNGEVNGIALAAVQNGGNAAATIYQLAQTRGWAEPAASPAPDPAPAESKVVDQANKAAAASRAVGAVGGGGTTRLTAAAIANMDIDEINSLPKGALEGALS